MVKWLVFFGITFVYMSLPIYAATKVAEGKEAETQYIANKAKSQVLVQKNKEFSLRTPDGKETAKPQIIKVKAGEEFYITNEEEFFIHNVYDVTDSSWVLKKQTPSSVAAISFDTPGKHSLRCAIHPTMKIEVEVME